MLNIKISLFSFLIIACFGCKSPKKELKIENLGFKIPISWQKVSQKGTDSQIGYVLLSDKDTMFYELSYYSSTLTESREIKLVPKKFLQQIDSSVADLSKIIFVDENKMDADLYFKQNVSFKPKGKYLLKIVFPRVTGIGITGLHIDSLYNTSVGNMKFSMYACNLSANLQSQVLEVIEDIKIQDRLKAN